MLAVVPVGSAADGWVKRALFARNAGTRGRLRRDAHAAQGPAARSPEVGQAAGLDPPSNIGGPRGPAGPAGPAGSDGSAAFVASAPAAVALGAAQTSVETLSLKAGSYAIVAKASLHATLDTSTPGVNCQLKAGTDGDQVDADLSSSSDDPVALVTTHTFAAAGAVTLTCAADDSGVTATDARILALRVGSVTAS